MERSADVVADADRKPIVSQFNRNDMGPIRIECDGDLRTTPPCAALIKITLLNHDALIQKVRCDGRNC